MQAEQRELRGRGGARTPPPEGRGRRLSRADSQVLPAKMTALSASVEPKSQGENTEAVPTVVIWNVLGNC